MSDDEKDEKLEKGKKAKRGRQMTPEMLEKLAAARVKALATKKAIKEKGKQGEIEALQKKMDKLKTGLDEQPKAEPSTPSPPPTAPAGAGLEIPKLVLSVEDAELTGSYIPGGVGYLGPAYLAQAAGVGAFNTAAGEKLALATEIAANDQTFANISQTQAPGSTSGNTSGNTGSSNSGGAAGLTTAVSGPSYTDAQAAYINAISSHIVKQGAFGGQE